MDELRVAVVGVGRMGLTHAENLAHRVRGARLVAVTTSSAERAAEVRRRCGAVSVYEKIEHLLEGERLDAAVISSSTSAHVANVESCAKAGLHILCEKPLALDLEGCDRAARAAHSAGVTLMVGHVRRFDSGYLEAKHIIDSGTIGRPLMYRSLSGDMDPPPPSFADLEVSGGLIVDSMYHDIYLGRWLMEDEIVRVHAEERMGDAFVTMPPTRPDLWPSSRTRRNARIGRMKKGEELWDATDQPRSTRPLLWDEEIRHALARRVGQAGLLHPDHGPLAGGGQPQEERHRADPHRQHRAPRAAHAQRLRHALREPDLRGRAALHGEARARPQPGAAATQLRRAPLPPPRHAGHGDRARERRPRAAHRRDARAVERRLPQADHPQQPRSALGAGGRRAAVLQALPAARDLPRHRLAPGRARVLPHQGSRRQVGHQLRPRRRVRDLAGLYLHPEMVDMAYAVDTEGISYLPDGHFDKSVDPFGRASRWSEGEGHFAIEMAGTPEGVVGKWRPTATEKAKRPLAAILAT
jgi:predicted dehydrogenase